MLSPSSLSSSTSLDQSTSLSTRNMAASESSCASGLLIPSSPDLPNIVNGFPRHNANSTSSATPRLGQQHQNSSSLSLYNNHVPAAFCSIPSINEDEQKPVDAPLFVVNPCFQSAIFHRQSSDLLLPASPCSSNEGSDGQVQVQQNPPLLRPRQSIQHGEENNGTNAIRNGLNSQQPRSMATRRTFSLQFVRPFTTTTAVIDNYSPTSSKLSLFTNHSTTGCSSGAGGGGGCCSRSAREHNRRFCLESQSAAVMLRPQISVLKFRTAHIWGLNAKNALHFAFCPFPQDWLAENAILQLTKLFSTNPTTVSARWMVQMKHLRDFVLQIRAKTQHLESGHRNKKLPTAQVKEEYSLYKLPLATVQASTNDGRPLPQFVVDIMAHIRGQAHLAEGIFRKNGSKARIDEIKDICSRLSPGQPIPRHLLDDSQVHDLGDSLKCYFRELPECLFTERLSKALENVLVDLPREWHFTGLHYCVLLLPTENREALLALLSFLQHVASHSAQNQMTALNLATCWMPSLFRFSQEDKGMGRNGTSAGGTIGRRLMRRKTISVPNERERSAYEGVKRILEKMIEGWQRLTRLPTPLAVEMANLGLDGCYDLGVPTKGDQFEFSEELHLNFRRQLFRLKEDYSNGWRCWQLHRVFPDGSQLLTRSINDMIPVKAFQVRTSIAAPPNLILNTILRDRHAYDSNVLECRRVGPSGQNFDIVRVRYRPGLDGGEKQSVLARRWTYCQAGSDSTCSLIECSIVPRGMDRMCMASGSSGSNVSVFESKFLIHEICPGHSQLTHIARVDFKGKSSQWYERVYAEMLVSQLGRLKKCLMTMRTRTRVDCPSGTIV